MPQAFAKQHGYSIDKYLPILMHDNGGGVGGGMTGQDFADPDDFVLDSTEEGVNVVADFRQTVCSP